MIAGISARNRDEVLASFSALADSQDFAAGMAQVMQTCILDQPQHKSVLCLEIGAEATRNPAVAETLARFDETVSAALTELLEKAEREGRIKPTMPTKELAQAMHVIADGLFWRRAIQPDFDAVSAGRALLALVAGALSETPQ